MHPRDERTARTRELLDVLGIVHCRDRPPAELSGACGSASPSPR
ncbi:hypothetical protein ACFC96_33800 [Streptomyces sp. NPDC055955]